jgi:hypothetical protein
VADRDDFSDHDNNGEEDSNQDDGLLAFLEKEDGKLISYDEKKQLYRTMRGFWNDHIDCDKAPVNWSSAGESLGTSFRNILENKFFYLRLCAGHWKAEELWKRNYHSWLRSLRRRTGGTQPRSQKRKRNDDEPENKDTQHQKKLKGKDCHRLRAL